MFVDLEPKNNRFRRLKSCENYDSWLEQTTLRSDKLQPVTGKKEAKRSPANGASHQLDKFVNVMTKLSQILSEFLQDAYQVDNAVRVTPFVVIPVQCFHKALINDSGERSIIDG